MRLAYREHHWRFFLPIGRRAQRLKFMVSIKGLIALDVLHRAI